MPDSAENNKEPNYNVFFGDKQLIPRVTFSRKGTHFCIYCGDVSDTREHAPSKVFLSNPYPADLPVLPACKKCNNGFSDDELYTEVYIDSLKYLSGRSDSLSAENQERIYRNTAFSDAQSDLSAYYNMGNLPYNKRISRILAKLAICHTVYELSEGYFSDDWNGKPTLIDYQFAFEMTENQAKEYDSLIIMNDKILPEVGSRVFGKIYVLEPILKSVTDDKTMKLQMMVMNWSDIQNYNYRYVAWFEKDSSFHVKMVIHDFLYAEVVFCEKTE